MRMKGLIKDKKFVIAIVLTLIFGFITFYSSFIFKRKPNIIYEILSDSNVLDVHTELSKLDIIYDGMSIKKSHNNLKIITLRVFNKGNEGVLEQHYASTDPLGFRIENGKLIERPELLSATSTYLQNRIKFDLKDSNSTVLFPNLIFDEDEYFEMKLLIIHDATVSPDIMPIGKIANMHDLKIVRHDQKEDSSLLRKLMKGSAIVFGAFIYIIGIALMATLLDTTIEFGKKRYRNKLVVAFNKKYSIVATDKYMHIFDTYIKFGKEKLSEMESALSNVDRLENLKPILAAYNKIDQYFKNNVSGSFNSPSLKIPAELKLIEELLDNGMLAISGQNYSVNKEWQKALVDFLKFLEGK